MAASYTPAWRASRDFAFSLLHVFKLKGASSLNLGN
jgi:hypothetical protein